MLRYRAFLIEDRPRFVDFDLAGMLGNFLHTGHYELPKAHQYIKKWYHRMAGLKIKNAK